MFDSKVKESNFIWDQPIFIIGNPRSGTSLLRIMLHNHSQIGIPPESHFFLWLEEKYQNWSLNQLESYLTDLYNSTKFETWQINKTDLKSFILEYEPQSYAQLNSLVYYFYSREKNKHIQYWGDKNKLWKEKLTTTLNYYPNARYIHLIRDGRDVACSFRELGAKKMESRYAPKLPTDISQIAEKWHTNISTIYNFQKRLNPQNTITIRYEDLLMNTESELKKICTFLKINFESNMLLFYLNKKEEIEPTEFYQWKEKLTSPPDVNNIGKYKEQLTKEEIEIFDSIAKNELKTFNYTL